ncbi:MAG: hypothetical protein ACKVWR_07535 [Acidimicrobiales bacterium]
MEQSASPLVSRVSPWADPVVDEVGHDPRSTYVETFWLGVLGPSAVWLLRRFAALLEQSPEGAELDAVETARALGLGGSLGPNGAFCRTVVRLRQFGMAREVGGGELAVRRRLPPLAERQLSRLPEVLQHQHRVWQEAELRTPRRLAVERRARQLALGLLELGCDLDGAQLELTRWRYEPAVSAAAAQWAWRRHRAAERQLDAAPG